MYNLRQLNIFQLYKKLPYIIVNKNYLIPQKPFKSNINQDNNIN